MVKPISVFPETCAMGPLPYPVPWHWLWQKLFVTVFTRTDTDSGESDGSSLQHFARSVTFHTPAPATGFQTWGLLISAYGQRTLLFLWSSRPTANLPLWICYWKPGLSDTDAKSNLSVLGQVDRIALLLCQAKGDTPGFCLENHVSPWGEFGVVL